MGDRAIILFTRVPVPGKTKTRLQPFLTGEACCRLHQAFILDIYRELQRLEPGCDLVVCYEPGGDVEQLRALLKGASRFLAQRGLGLGKRMHNAISDLLDQGYQSCVLVGSDVPLLRAEAVRDAFRILEGKDLVLCPTEDGGYCLIGLKQPCEALFQIPYSVATVKEDTLRAAVQAGITWGLVQEMFDIDDAADLLRLADVLSAEEPWRCAETRTALHTLLEKGGGHERHRSDTDTQL